MIKAFHRRTQIGQGSWSALFVEVAGSRASDSTYFQSVAHHYEVFKGMHRTLTHSENLRMYFEFWPAGLRRAGCEPMELLAFLKQLGLKLYRVEGKQLTRLVNPNGLDKCF
jgi:hypothetical protein